MKKIISILLLLTILLSFSGCGQKLELNEESRVTLTFKVDKVRLNRTLTSTESKVIYEVLNGVQALDLPTESESCGFSENVSLTIDNVIYAMAQDECCMLKNLETGELIMLSQEKYSQIAALFEYYGGYFPCLPTEPTEP